MVFPHRVQGIHHPGLNGFPDKIPQGNSGNSGKQDGIRKDGMGSFGGLWSGRLSCCFTNRNQHGIQVNAKDIQVFIPQKVGEPNAGGFPASGPSCSWKGSIHGLEHLLECTR